MNGASVCAQSALATLLRPENFKIQHHIFSSVFWHVTRNFVYNLTILRLANKQLIRGLPIPASIVYLRQERHCLSAAAINREDNVYTHQVFPCLGGEAL